MSRVAGIVGICCAVVFGYGFLQERDRADRLAREAVHPVDTPPPVMQAVPGEKVYLVKAYASTIPPTSGDRIQFQKVQQPDLPKCRETLDRLIKQVKAGKILATCWKVKE